MSVLIRGAEVDGRHVDVRLNGPRVVEVGRQLSWRLNDELVDARGGALLPGLHDHHVHVLASAAAVTSVRCGPPDVRDERELARTLARASPGPDGWLRGIDYHESVAGRLDRYRLDALAPEHPVRVQHRTGALWVVNSAGVRRLRLEDAPSFGVDRAADGQPTGRLWRWDAELRERLTSSVPDVGRFADLLAGFGVTGMTDATPRLSASSAAVLAEAVGRGKIPQHVVALGLDAALPPISTGPWKIVLDDAALPPLEDLVVEIRDVHEDHRAVAIHVVTRASFVLALAALDAAGPLAGDRLEHGAVIPAECLAQLAARDLAVVTQPIFVHQRGDEYLQEVPKSDLPDLFRYASLVAAGVRVAPSSDTPYGDPDPWKAIAAARDRMTRSGIELGIEERIAPATVLAGYLSRADDPGGPARTVSAGAEADLCLLHVPLAVALASPEAAAVRAVVRDGAWL